MNQINDDSSKKNIMVIQKDETIDVFDVNTDDVWIITPEKTYPVHKSEVINEHNKIIKQKQLQKRKALIQNKNKTVIQRVIDFFTEY